MEPIAVRNMRLKQIAMTNGFMLGVTILFFVFISFYQISFTPFFFALGIVVFVLAIYGLSKSDSTKSVIPFFEKIAVYEKEKMGKEFKKERRANNVSRLVLSGILFLQAYIYRDLTDLTFEVDFLFMTLMLLFLLVLTNGSLLLRFRKVDRSTSELDMRCYTCKSNLIAVVVGIIFAVIMIMVTLLFVFSGI